MAKKQRKQQQKKQQKPQAKGKPVAKPCCNGAAQAEATAKPESGEAAIQLPKDQEAAEVGQVLGLENLGNTCFFNSVVQVLLASSPVVDHFLPAGKRGPLGQGLHEITKASYGSGKEDPLNSTAILEKGKKRKLNAASKTVAPQRLHSAVLSIAPQFKGGAQQDSHELMRLLLDGLHTEEVKAVRARAKGSCPPQNDEGREHAMNPSSFVSQAFGAKLASHIECNGCHHVACTLEDFMDISVEVPQPHLEEFLDACSGSNGPSKGKKRVTGTKSAKKGGEAAKSDSAEEGSSLSAKQKKKQAKHAQKEADFQRKKERRRNTKMDDPHEAVGSPPASIKQSKQHLLSKEDNSGTGQDEGQQPELQPTVLAGAMDAPGAADAGGLQQHEESWDVQISCTRDAEVEHTERDKNNSAQPQMTQTGLMPATTELQKLSGGCKEIEEAQESYPGAKQAKSHPKKAREASEQAKCPASSKQTAQQSAAARVNAGSGTADKAAGISKEAKDVSQYFTPDKGDCEEGGQAGGSESGDMPELGSLFDIPESDAVSAASFEGEQQGKGQTVLACLAAFFTPEEVTWECLAETAARKNDAANGLVTPERQDQRLGLKARGVSFSEERPAVRLIPGSIEQRGTNFREALRGYAPFCRPLKVGDAFLLVTAENDSMSRDVLRLSLRPQDATTATMAVLDDSIEVAEVPIETIEESDDEEEQANVAHTAQLLMDCVADMVLFEGVDDMRRMVATGMQLYPCKLPTVVRGNLPDKLGGGSWEYPMQTPRTPKSPGLTTHKSYLSCQPSSPASSTLASALSQSLNEPSTPAAASITSFESIDLGNSPVKQPSRSSCDDCSPKYFPATENGSTGSNGHKSFLAGQLGGEESCSNSAVAMQQAEQHSPWIGSGDSKPSHSTKASAYHSMSSVDSVPPCESMLSSRNRDLPALKVSTQPNGKGTSCSEDADCCPAQESPPAADAPKPGSLSEEDALANGSSQAGDGQLQYESPATPDGVSANQQLQINSTRGREGGSNQSPGSTPSPSRQAVEDITMSETSGQSSPAQAVEDEPTSTYLSPEEGGQNPSSAKGKLKTGLKNVQQTAKKGYLIHRAPTLLTVHLKRFQIDYRGKPQKISGIIPFGTWLDVAPYCDPEGPDAAGAQYDLVGVVEHRGTSMQSGHYRAYVRRMPLPAASESVPATAPEKQSHLEEGVGKGQQQQDGTLESRESEDSMANPESRGSISEVGSAGEHASLISAAVKNGNKPNRCGEAVWFQASDASVRRADVEEVLKCEAYILLYQRTT